MLAELQAAMPVPPFFVIRREAFSETGLSEALERLGPGPFAVRSSGVEEDGASAAHAGQFDTRLNVPAGEVEAAALEVWRSGFSESLAEYRRARGLSGEPQPPAVLVQRMVQPQAAGVAFTADPVSGDTGVVVVSAVAGLADRLVAGEVDGDVYRLDRSGRLLEPVTGVLTQAQAAEVAALALKAEAHFGAPQDVEWALAEDGLFLLQSRPITTLKQAEEPLTVWDNANIVESYPGVVSPLTFSFARDVYSHVYRAFCRLMGVSEPAVAANRDAFETMLGRVHGRIYYSLNAWYRLLSLFPGFQANRAFMEQMMGVSETLPAELAEKIAPRKGGGWDRFIDGLSMVRVALGLVWHGVVLPRTIRRFYIRLNQALSPSNEAIGEMAAPELAAEYRKLEAALLERWDAPLINDFLCMFAFGASRKALERWAGPEGLALHSDVMIGQGDIISAEPAKRIAVMADLARGRPEVIAALEGGQLTGDVQLERLVADYLAKFGDRCTEELKLESTTLHEDRSPLLAAIASGAKGEVSRPAPQRRSAKEDLDGLLAGKPVKRAAAGWLLGWAKERVRDRENLRFERTRLFGRVRRIVRAGGARLCEARLLDEVDDVFFLTIEEWLGAIEGGLVGRDLRALVAMRRREHEEDVAKPDPPERFEVRGAFLPGLSRMRSRAAPAGEGEARTGQACCAGVVEARVRVIADPRTQALERGEILVARQTDPGWIAIFANAAGVIAERGSLLSHSAIVAREMGTPCVVALKGATEWLSTGDLVRLDGGTGLVERLERAP